MGFMVVNGHWISQHFAVRVTTHICTKLGLRGSSREKWIFKNSLDAEADDVQLTHTNRVIEEILHKMCKAVDKVTE